MDKNSTVLSKTITVLLKIINGLGKNSIEKQNNSNEKFKKKLF
ncbi:hypothetical protein OX284_002030 [Flavobacterium sp. SUN046]|nr:hypothetical protein [Flavobacterium sp. SUN046]MEC4048193.1 hypothetical protein [Flavobacterium sp. SUN046]